MYNRVNIIESYPDDEKALAVRAEICKKSGIRAENNPDVIFNAYDEDYKAVATASVFADTLRSFAVLPEYRGRGILNKLLTAVRSYQVRQGCLHSFVYTKLKNVDMFKDAGYRTVAKASKAVLMENPPSFEAYLQRLLSESEAAFAGYGEKTAAGATAGAIVMNTDPLTSGHMYLINRAAEDCDFLHLFVLSESRSFLAPAKRKAILIEAVKNINNIVLHDTDSYMISSATFPSYFLEDEEEIVKTQSELDLEIFKRVADVLAIKKRFAGSEELSKVTAVYNQMMAKYLPEAGVKFVEIARKKNKDGEIISASRVRELYKQHDFEAMQNFTEDFVIDILREMAEKEQA